jgi:NMD protein affecting ribosome stability and mRNA decay
MWEARMKNYLMMTCKETAQQLSDAQDCSLPWRERFALRAHLTFCRSCSAYARQLAWLRRLFSCLDGSNASAYLSESGKKRIRLLLKEQARDDVSGTREPPES